jgi:hypothetical protein
VGFEFDCFADPAVFLPDPSVLARSASRFNRPCPAQYGDVSDVTGANLLPGTTLASGVPEPLVPSPNHTHNPVTGAANEKKKVRVRQ